MRPAAARMRTANATGEGSATSCIFAFPPKNYYHNCVLVRDWNGGSTLQKMKVAEAVGNPVNVRAEEEGVQVQSGVVTRGRTVGRGNNVDSWH